MDGKTVGISVNNLFTTGMDLMLEVELRIDMIHDDDDLKASTIIMWIT